MYKKKVITCYGNKQTNVNEKGITKKYISKDTILISIVDPR